jgi:hypothetical protein
MAWFLGGQHQADSQLPTHRIAELHLPVNFLLAFVRCILKCCIATSTSFACLSQPSLGVSSLDLGRSATPNGLFSWPQPKLRSDAEMLRRLFGGGRPGRLNRHFREHATAKVGQIGRQFVEAPARLQSLLVDVE